MSLKYDLILKGGLLIDPSQNINENLDIAFKNGKVASIKKSISAIKSEKTISVNKLIVTPGLIDIHTHVYWGGTSLGIDAEEFCRKSAVTTAVDTGSTGPGNFYGFRRHVIEKSAVKILAFLHISHAGIYAFSERVMVGESENLKMLDPISATEIIEANKDIIVGIKVRVGKNTSGNNGILPLEYALKVSEKTNLPIMVHIDEAPPEYGEVLKYMRKGDILTHCFRPSPNSPLGSNGEILPEVLDARKRGVFFDVGHGMGSFCFDVTKTMIKKRFYPDTISSDIHKLCINGPAHDLLTTLSKFLNLGMPLYKVIESATKNASVALNRRTIGGLKEGSVGDAAILNIDTGHYKFSDVTGTNLIGKRRINLSAVVLNGSLWHSKNPNFSSRV